MIPLHLGGAHSQPRMSPDLSNSGLLSVTLALSSLTKVSKVLLLKKMLGIGSYRTAWYLCHRIREAMGNDPLTDPTLVGVVEVDETMIGGRPGLGGSRRLSASWRGGKPTGEEIAAPWGLRACLRLDSQRTSVHDLRHPAGNRTETPTRCVHFCALSSPPEPHPTEPGRDRKAE